MRIDLKRDHKQLYQPPIGEFTEVDVTPADYLAIAGQGDPNTSPDYAVAVESLYTLGYAVRACFKQRTGDDFVVGPLEGLWHADDPADFTAGAKHRWRWTMLVPLPGEVSADDVATARPAAARKKPHLPIDRVELRTLHEGRCLQVMHLGSHDDEAPVLHRLHHELMPQRGLTWNGPHHEVYLGDPRRTAPDKLRTVLRQPVRPR